MKNTEDTYIGQDGLLHCGRCGTARQVRLKIFGKSVTVNCLCECQSKERDKIEAGKKIEALEKNRKMCFANKAMHEQLFENAQNEPVTNFCENYVKEFDTMKKDGRGLLFHGSVGTGKSFHATCIANALIDEGYRVLFTNITEIESKMNEGFSPEQLNRYDLVIFDDFGVERNTEYMNEKLFSIIDSRYRSGLPMIITTNTSIEEFKKPADLRSQRIYDRILDKCHPVEFTGESKRRLRIKDNFLKTKELLNESN